MKTMETKVKPKIRIVLKLTLVGEPHFQCLIKGIKYRFLTHALINFKASFD
jgi:hypothetical protein